MTLLYSKLVERYANDLVLKPDLIWAIMIQESDQNPLAVRFEPKWTYLKDPEKYSEKLKITTATETMLQSCSWGLLQCMGTVAREHGFEGYLQELSAVEIGLKYGLMHLQQFVHKMGDCDDAIASYNAGGIRRLGFKYVNQHYIDSVNRLRAKVQVELNGGV